MSFVSEYLADCSKLLELGAEQIEIRRTVLGRPIFAFEIGCGYPKILAQYAIHAREHITYYLANLHCVSLLKTIKKGTGTIYILPVINVDGVALCLDGVDSAGAMADNLLELNRGTDFSLWKANARGVDLNVNFDARWGTGKKNVLNAGAQNYIGSSPNSEPETRSLIAFTEQIKPDITLSFHSKGEVIYWDFHQNPSALVRDKKIGKMLAKSTGYRLSRSGASAGGYKDWCIEHLGIPAYTIEVGNDSIPHPIEKEHLLQIFDETKNIFADLIAYFRK